MHNTIEVGIFDCEVVQMSLLNVLLSKLRSIIHSEEFFQRNRTSEAAFTRKRILGFVATLTYILWCAKTSLPSTLRAFLEGCLGGKRSCTRQAFSKRRKLIKPEAFKELFTLSAEFLAKNVRPSKEFLRVLAVDGSRVNLPTHPELVQKFGIQKGTGNLPQALLSTLYDVGNRIVLDMQIRPHNGNEREMALCHIERIKQLLGSQPYLLIFDRGYPSGKLLEMLIENHVLFLMRCPSEFVRGLDRKEPDAWFAHKFHSVKHALSFRVIRAPLPNGTEEILCTNLPNEYSAFEITELYLNRWKIEINYNFLKNRVQLENLSGITYCAFLQHLYACLLMCNLCGAYYCDHSEYESEAGSVPKIKLRLDREGKCQCEHSHDRKINMATVLAAIRSILPRALVLRHTRLKHLVQTIDVSRVKNVLRYDKKGRIRPRLRLHPSLKFTLSQRPGV